MLYRKHVPPVLVVVLSALSSSIQAELQPRCGECWCIFNGELDECPTNQTGIADTFTPDKFQIYETFTLTNTDDPYLKLRTADGEECFPFANVLGPLEDYPKSNLQQCALPAASTNNETVCAYLYEEGTECQGRNYQVLSYDSVADAEAAGAVVTHTGACGVCSTAHDLWTRMLKINDFETDTLLCGVSYILNPDKENRFDALTECAMNVGLTSECALLWAHYGAAVLSVCSSECNTGTGSETNGPAPECTLAACGACPAPWKDDFVTLSGRTMEGSGISEGTAKACSRFSRIEHDPCVQATTGSELESAPTPVPATSNSPPAVRLEIFVSLVSITLSATAAAF